MSKYEELYYRQYFSLRNEVGFALMLIGVQTGTAIRNVWGIELVNIIMATSVLCVMNFRNAFSFKFPCWNNFFSLIWIFQIIELIYSLNCRADISTYIPMHYYLLAITFALSTQNKGLDFRFSDVIFMYLSAFISLVVAFQATHGFVGVYTTDEFYQADIGTSQLEQGGDKITMGRALLFSVICSIVYKRRHQWELFVKVVVIACSFVGLMMFNTRASMIVSIICLLIYIIKKSQLISGAAFLSKRTLNLFFKYSLFATTIFLIVYFQIDYVREMVDNLLFNFTRGVLTLFGDNSFGEDQSTIYRHTVMRKISQTETSIGELLFGHGYYTIYIDIPMFQAFYDFGIFGILYFIILGYMPAKYTLKYNTTKVPVMIILLFAVQYLFDQAYCGLPYYFFQFMPIILLVFFYNNNNSNYESVFIPSTSR